MNFVLAEAVKSIKTVVERISKRGFYVRRTN